jgi:hypothetical protein
VSGRTSDDPGELILIRSDGYVAAPVSTAGIDALKRYLDSLGQ